jgi:pimeloyl-ACP methyl ester carboxylesterase
MSAEASRVPSSTVKIAGIDLEMFETGTGPPLLWLHSGAGFSARDGFVEPIAARRRLLVPSHPGFGRSSLPDWLDSIDDIAHVYLELLDRLSILNVDLVGCSIGGWIAAEMATKAPERIRRLVMIGPVGVKVGPADKLDVPDIFAMPADQVDRLLRHDPNASKADPKTLSDDALAVMLRNRETLALLTWEPWMHNPKLRYRLHRAAMPALFVRGASDGFVSADYLAAYAALLPRASIVTVPAAGHAPQLETPEKLAAAVLEFLDG